MNIVFFHNNGIIPNSGGISRITATLGKLFSGKNNNVWYMGIRNTLHGFSYSEKQVFLPSLNLFSVENIEYVRNFAFVNSIDIIINQAALNPKSVLFLKKCVKETDSFKVISCIHNSILTPVVFAAYQKEYNLKKHGLGFVFKIMKFRLIADLITRAYILKYRKYYLSILNNSDSVIVLNKGQRIELLKISGAQDSNKIRVIPNCIDILDNPSDDKENTVLWVGTFDYCVKRPDNMLRIWKMVEDSFLNWKLQMLGDGASLLEMKKLAQSFNLRNVEFVGRVDPNKYYQKAKITCVTSVHESFSLVTAESMMNGVVPIVFNSFTAAPLLINNLKDGVLVPAFNLDMFAINLSTLMSNDTELLRMRKESVKSVKQFSFENIYNKWSESFKAVSNE